ncbi:vascular cell adhesion protein 1-like isoform X2 [Carcharodon carcharias]|uniref:vascular cell adhesion protein 1-like isoform X2 n=1 Tax=Carcharodon carcharias TaxID=13397 RepID=UPI001B7F23CB|nr:vascular cell adhesion protein 1-like isoform X2 [Carcharodon carcharias]
MASGRPYLYGALTLAVLIATGSTFSLKLQPKSKLWTRIGEKLVLSCESIDCPSPTFSWRTVTDNPLGGTVNSQGSVSTLTFSPVTRQNENTYICSVTYKGETQQRRVQVNVYSFPDEPVLETVGPLEVGKNGTLRCTVPDVYPVSLEVELLKGETSLNKQNFFRTPKVTISSQLVPEVGDSGKEVTCRARFLINDIQDKSLEGKLTLQVLYAPRMTNISVTPSHTVREGQDVRLICATDSSPPARIVWSKASADGWSVIAEEKLSLQLPAAQVADTGMYRCEASNKLGGEARELEIHIQGAPRDTRLSVTPSVVKEGDYVSVTCTSHSNPSAHIVLRKKSETGLTVLDSENGTFTIDAAQFGDAGQYECEASNDLGTDNTTAELTVLGAPRDTRLSVTPSVVKEGDYISVTCTSHSNPSAHIVLRKKSESGLTVLDSENGIFTIDAAQFGDAGQYECEASNDLGTDNTMAELTVLGAPRDTRLSVTPSVVKEGDYVSVTCTSHSNPSAHIVLRKKSETGLTVLDSENGIFIIDAAQFVDAGQYECEASNDMGRQIQSTELIVQVLTLWAHPSMLVSEGENVTIGCTVHSNSSAKFTWKKLETNSEVTLCSTSDYFTIHEISQSDAGLYEVEVINELGNQTGFVEITVMERKLDVIPVETNPTGILVTTSCGALASTGVLLSALYYIYRKSNLRGSYHMPREQIL